jgi:hypothetical protein
MVGDEVVDLVEVERATDAGEVVDRPLGREAHRDSDVAELQVEIDDDGALALLRQRHGEVAGGQRLPGPALRPDDADHRARRPSRGRAAASRHHLLQRKLEVRRRRRQGQQVVGSHLERPL